MRPIALAALVSLGASSAVGQTAYVPGVPTYGNFIVRGGAVTVGTGPGNLPTNPLTGQPWVMTVPGAGPNGTGAVLPIVQTSPRAIVDWQGFSIDQWSAVNITQPGPTSVLLNRVTGPANPSVIAGSLTANGRVFLVNPNGVTFTGTSVVNVGGLVASTLAMSTSDTDFLGGTNTIAFGPSSNSSVDNQGQITTPFGGTVALISGNTANSGTITAPGGTAGLAAGGTVTLDIGGDGLTKLTVTAGSFRGVTNTGTLQADGGRVALMAGGGESTPMGVVNTRGVLRANSLGGRNGEIVLDSGSSTAGVTLTGGSLSVAGPDAGQAGGTIDIKGRSILVERYQAFSSFPGINEPTTFNASGNAGGGSITLRATAVGEQPQTGALAVAAGTTFDASATGTGNGGQVKLLGERTLRAYGSITAKGGPAGGDGGLVETSGGYAIPVGETGGGFDLAGVRVDASAPGGGKAGTWLVDPFDVTIGHGAVAGALPATGVFDPVTTTLLQDGDINAALNSGTNVKVTTGSAGTGSGSITLNADVNINYVGSKGPLTLELAANRDITAQGAGTVIQSSGGGGPLNVVFNAGTNPDGSLAPAGGQIIYAGSIYSNGGDVTMNARTTAFDQSGIFLGGTIDTRGGNVIGPGGSTGGSNANTGGNVQLTGSNSNRNAVTGTLGNTGVRLLGAQILTSTGSVTINGNGQAGNGVEMDGGAAISTTSGAVTLTGNARTRTYQSGLVLPTAGVLISQSSIGTVSGGITLRGYVDDTSPATDSAGVSMANGALLSTTGGGNIEVTGQALGTGNGVLLQPGSAGISGSAQVVLRASNNGTTDAISIASPVNAGTVINLRPGGVDAAGNGFDSVANPITLGGSAATGFALSAAELALLGGPAVVVGSNAHAGDINVVGALSLAPRLTLQNQGGAGNINLNASVNAPQVALLAGGSVTQAAGTSITAGSLLARANTGNVLLSSPANDVGTVTGTAAGRFEYVDANALTIGPVSVTTFDAAGNTSQLDAATSMAAGNVFVRNLQGDLSLASAVSSTAGADLVAAARFQNIGGGSIGGAPWRVWADTWVGETRGGLRGSGPLPNLYHCAYLGLCSVSVSPGDNHFIYAQQPVATVVFGDYARPFGGVNPLFFYSIGGLILGDTGVGIGGTSSSPAGRFSLPGTYPVNGNFTSAEGYAVNVVPGRLRVLDVSQLPKVDVLRDLPTTYLYDRNIGQAPICLATGPLDGDRASQGGDVLAREWSRVRSRPNLLNCVDTERRNGCADF